MVDIDGLLEAYPEDKLLRIFVKPVVDYPISYATAPKCSTLNFAVLLTHLIDSDPRCCISLFVLKLVIARCLLTHCDTVCVYQLGVGVPVYVVWMAVVAFYLPYLHYKHTKMLESRAARNRDK